MIIRHLTPILALLMLVALIDNRSATADVQPTKRFGESKLMVRSCRNEQETIAAALRHLASGDYKLTTLARNTLLNVAHRSNECKLAVVGALLENMDRPNLDFERQPSNYYLWREGSPLLGELKAVDALDLLISHLDLTNGFHSSSMVFQPAILGIIQMGKAATPKLAIALQNPKARIRMAAVYCLTDIGGESARSALLQAQEHENNTCVARFIRVSLSTFAYKSKSGILFDNEAPQANTDARQSWLMAYHCVE